MAEEPEQSQDNVDDGQDAVARQQDAFTPQQDAISAEQMWHTYMTTGKRPERLHNRWHARTLRPLVRKMPSDPRCLICYYPFRGFGGRLARGVLGIKPSKLNPKLCNVCEIAADEYQGGAELEISMLFADVRGSTAMAENMSPTEFSRLIDRFYKATTKEIFEANGMVEKIIGDEVTGFFVPGFAGQKHARVAVETAQCILKATGHKKVSGPWVPVGIGVHTGVAFVGAVSTENGASDITILGDAVNTAARLASLAGPGEVIASDDSIRAAGLSTAGMENRRLQLKGRSQPVDAWALR
ncbi:MAG: adenylate/guanylate cyclase domain-containing protein [Chloroflexota bacterium]|nr:MAG: adenylate/guanylate cyclase domain-containing protein [Chloroflexota bacterium]